MKQIQIYLKDTLIQPRINSSAGRYRPDLEGATAPDLFARQCTEAITNTLSTVASVFEYPKGRP